MKKNIWLKLSKSPFLAASFGIVLWLVAFLAGYVYLVEFHGNPLLLLGAACVAAGVTIGLTFFFAWQQWRSFQATRVNSESLPHTSGGALWNRELP